MSEGVLTKTTTAVFPRESKKWKSDNDDKHDHGQEKRRPSTFVEGQNKNIQNQFKSIKINQKSSNIYNIYIITFTEGRNRGDKEDRNRTVTNTKEKHTILKTHDFEESAFRPTSSPGARQFEKGSWLSNTPR